MVRAVVELTERFQRGREHFSLINLSEVRFFQGATLVKTRYCFENCILLKRGSWLPFWTVVSWIEYTKNIWYSSNNARYTSPRSRFLRSAPFFHWSRKPVEPDRITLVENAWPRKTSITASKTQLTMGAHRPPCLLPGLPTSHSNFHGENVNYFFLHLTGQNFAPPSCSRGCDPNHGEELLSPTPTVLLAHLRPPIHPTTLVFLFVI